MYYVYTVKCDSYKSIEILKGHSKINELNNNECSPEWNVCKMGDVNNFNRCFVSTKPVFRHFIGSALQTLIETGCS